MQAVDVGIVGRLSSSDSDLVVGVRGLEGEDVAACVLGEQADDVADTEIVVGGGHSPIGITGASGRVVVQQPIVVLEHISLCRSSIAQNGADYGR